MDNVPSALQLGLIESFTDREEVIALFKKMQDAENSGQARILSIKGNSGTGKTQLLKYLQQTHCEPRNWSWGSLSFAQQPPAFYPIIEVLSNILRTGIPEERWIHYEEQRTFQEQDYMRKPISIDQRINAESGATIANPTQSVTGDFTHLSRDRRILLRAQLTRILLELARSCEKPCCLFVDGYERFEADSEANPFVPDLLEEDLVGWFWHDVILQLVGVMPAPLLVVTCGWNWPTLVSYTSVELKDFGARHVHTYLEKVGLLPLPEDVASTEEEVVKAFVDVTRGHPLVLSMAAILFATFPTHERTAERLKISGEVKLSSQARTAWVHERLLTRLPEPYRTLLEHAPILRDFDQETLQVLLQHDEEIAALFNDRVYEAFLRYPFVIVDEDEQSGSLLQARLHELVRRIQCATLHRLHPETCQQLHQALAEHYQQRLETLLAADEEPGVSLSEEQEAILAEQIFRALTESFYHALQVPELQEETFDGWLEETEFFIAIHRRQSATPTEGLWRTNAGQAQENRAQQLYQMENPYFRDNRHGLAQIMLEVVSQLCQEGCSFLHKESLAYSRYLALSSTFLTREARYKDAQVEMEHAIILLQKYDQTHLLALCYNELFLIHRSQENLSQAAECLDLALQIFKVEPMYDGIAQFFNNLALAAIDNGQLDQAESYQREVLRLYKELEDGPQFAQAQGNLGRIYHLRGEREKALIQYRLAANYFEDIQAYDGSAVFLNNIGVIYREQEQFDQALGYFEDVENRYRELGTLNMHPWTLINIADVYNLQQRDSEAYEYFNRALAILKEVEAGGGGELFSFMRVYRGLAYHYFQQKKWSDVLHYCQDLLELATRRNNPWARFTALVDLAAFYSERKETAKAIAHYEQVIPLLQEEQATDLLADTHLHLANEYRTLRRTEQAATHYTLACQYFQQNKQQEQLAQNLIDFADLYHSGFLVLEAQQKYEEAYAIFWKIGDMGSMMVVRNKQGALASEGRDWTQALLLHEQALRFFRGRRDLPNWALTLYYLGLLQSRQGLYEQALSFFQQALALQEHETDHKVVNAILYELGNACMLISEEQKARYYYEQILQRSRQSQDISTECGALLALAELAIFSGKPSTADPYLVQVLENVHALEEQRAEAHYGLGEIARLAGKHTEAWTHYREARSIWSQARHRARLALVQVRLGQLLYREDQPVKAIAELEPVLRICAQTPAPRAHVLALYTLGEIAERQDQPTQAIDYYQQALTLYGPEVPIRDRARVLAAIGKLSLMRGDFSQGATCLYRALCAYETQGPSTIPDLLAVLDALIRCHQEADDQDKVLAYRKYRQRCERNRSHAL